MMALIPAERFYKSNWIEYHRNLCFMIKDSKPNTLLLGDSIIAGLSRYPNVWNECLALINALNLGIGGNGVENAQWCAIDLLLPLPVKNIVILCGTNNIPKGSLRDIDDCIISTGSKFRKKPNSINVIVCGLIPRDECWSVTKVLINEVNEILNYQCNINGFAFIFQDYGWTLANSSLDCPLFYKDLLHLIKVNNFNFNSIQYSLINLSSTNSNKSYSDITRQKVQTTNWNVLAERSDFICFKMKAVFTPSSYNV